MENLPPKSPTRTAENITCWPNFQPPSPGMELNNRSRTEDFVGFSASRRRTHMRSVSDMSMALVEEVERTRLNDEAHLIMSVLNNELEDANSASSSSAAQKRGRREQKHEKHEEVESFKCDCNDQQPCQLHQTRDWSELATPSPNQAFHDPNRVKRILANRQSAQRSRVRKLQYISELERSMIRLQEVSMLFPRVAYLDHQRTMLNVDNTALKSKIAALSHDKLFKDAHHEALKREIERLKQVYHQQSSFDTTTPTLNP